MRSLRDLHDKIIVSIDPVALYDFQLGAHYLAQLGIFIHQEAKQVGLRIVYGHVALCGFTVIDHIRPIPDPLCTGTLKLQSIGGNSSRMCSTNM